MANLRLKNVVKSFGNNVVVRDFNLEVKDGEFMVFVGPSGCGKSTTLRMIAGLEEVSAGDIYIGDRRINDVAPKDRDIAMVFQNYALYPHMSVFENLAFGLRLRKVAGAEVDTRVHQAAQMLGLQGLLGRRPRELSGGQRQRVALGRAMVRNPKVFLMDEPLSNLDAKLRVQMRTELSKLHQRLRTTTIYVTHDQVEAMTMGDRIVVMKDGIVQQVAPPQDLYDRPANVFVASFIGSPAMNFLHGRLEASAERLLFDSGTFKVELPASLRESAECYIGKPVLLGVRPEDILAEAEFVDSHPMAMFEAIVEVVEPLGSEVYLYLRSGETSLTTREGGRMGFRDGDRINVALRVEKVHLFDPETELAIGRRDQPSER